MSNDFQEQVEGVITDLDDGFEKAYEKFRSDYVENKARSTFMMFCHDWFEEEIAPLFRKDKPVDERLLEFKCELARVVKGVGEGVQETVREMQESGRLPRQSDKVTHPEPLSLEAKTLLAYVQKSTQTYQFHYLHGRYLSTLTGLPRDAVFRLLRQMEYAGYLARTKTETRPPGVHQARRRYEVLIPLPADEVESLVDDSTLRRVLYSAIKEAYQLDTDGSIDSDKVLMVLEAARNSLITMPFKLRQELQECIDSLQNNEE
jgi:hypothetical protein